MKYQSLAVEILNLLGYDDPVGDEWISDFEEEKQTELPKVHREFMRFAHNCPLFETSDIWVDKHIRFLSDDTDECDEDILMIGSDFSASIVKMGIAKKEFEYETLFDFEEGEDIKEELDE